MEKIDNQIMENQLYNVSYLQETQKLLADMKNDSYTPFLSVHGKIADVGCGMGGDVINMATMVDDERVSIIGIDASKEMIDQANSTKGALKNVEFLIGDAEKLPFSNAELDGLRAERLLQHLANPAHVFQEFYRVTKDNAPIVIVETDWNSISFYNGDYEVIRKLKEYLSTTNVKNGGAATNLIHYLATTGFTDIDIRLFPLVSRSLAQCMFILRIDHALETMRDQGHITSKAHEAFLESLRDADNGNRFVCSINLAVVTARK